MHVYSDTMHAAAWEPSSSVSKYGLSLFVNSRLTGLKELGAPFKLHRRRRIALLLDFNTPVQKSVFV